MQLGSVARLQSTGGESVQQVGGVGPRRQADRLDATVEVSVIGRGPGPERTLDAVQVPRKDVSHWIVVPVLVSGGELLVTMVPSPPKGPSDL